MKIELRIGRFQVIFSFEMEGFVFWEKKGKNLGNFWALRKYNQRKKSFYSEFFENICLIYRRKVEESGAKNGNSASVPILLL